METGELCLPPCCLVNCGCRPFSGAGAKPGVWSLGAWTPHSLVAERTESTARVSEADDLLSGGRRQMEPTAQEIWEPLGSSDRSVGAGERSGIAGVPRRTTLQRFPLYSYRSAAAPGRIAPAAHFVSICPRVGEPGASSIGVSCFTGNMAVALPAVFRRGRRTRSSRTAPADPLLCRGSVSRHVGAVSVERGGGLFADAREREMGPPTGLEHRAWSRRVAASRRLR